MSAKDFLDWLYLTNNKRQKFKNEFTNVFLVIEWEKIRDNT